MYRWDVINYIIKSKNYKRYLEIGVDQKHTWNAIDITTKVGVDPNVRTTHQTTSDNFFAIHKEKFDIIFIDGLHERNQVLRDINNSLNSLENGGTILVHDCNPCEPKRIGLAWSGTVWEAIAILRSTRTDLSMTTINEDTGICVIQPGSQELFKGELEFTYDFLNINRDKLLNLISFEDWTKQ